MAHVPIIRKDSLGDEIEQLHQRIARRAYELFLKGQVHRCEFSAGQFSRSLPFPAPVDVTRAKADYQNGVLHINTPIAPEAKARVGSRAA